MKKTPPYLKTGDTIGIVSMAGRCNKEHLQTAVEVFNSWGLKVEQSENIFNYENQFASSDENRLADLNSMIENDKIKAIISLRGGYGSVRLLEKINYKKLAENPKWIIGFSDITAIHSAIAIKSNIKSLHATMPVNFDSTHKNSLDTLHKALFGEKVEYRTPNNELNRIGKAKGELVGGNLSVLYSLRGTEYDIDTKGKILFIEDLNEYLYHLDRMMMNFKLGEKLADLKGLIIGAFSDMQDNETKFGKNAYEIILDAVKDYNYPIIFDFKAGHIKENNALIFGQEVEIDVSKSENCSIIF